jgi:hypothetical protein
MMRLAIPGALMAAVCVLAFSPGCTVNISGPELFQADEDVSLSSSTTDLSVLRVEWQAGNVNIEFDPTAEQISVTGAKRVTAESQETADSGLEVFEITWNEQESDPPEATLKFESPNDTRFYAASVNIVLPYALELRVSHDFGNVTIDGNDGATFVQLDAGDLTVTNQSGDLDVDVDDGDIDITSEDGNVEVILNAGNADVDASPAAGNRVRVAVDLGDLTVRVPDDFAADLYLEVDLGDVDANLSGFDVTEEDSSNHRVSAVLNGGGGTVDARVDLGDVNFGPLS